MQWSKLETAQKCKYTNTQTHRDTQTQCKLEVLKPQLENIFMRQHFWIQTNTP